MGFLDRISSPDDLRGLSTSDLEGLATEIRKLIIETTSKTGGHVAPNLGVVELTLALHYVFDAASSQIFWDVGHQCYAHKIVTGRRDRFQMLRQFQGLSGFPKRAESEHDCFDAGHSGNSISVALGASVGGRLLGRRRRSIAVVGDGSVVTGMAFEALNHAGEMKEDLVVVLNDNEMSIARSTGAMAAYLNRIITGRMYNRLRGDVWNLLGLMPEDLSGKARLAARKIEEGMKNLVVPSLLFEELGFRYVGPVAGHNLSELISTFRRVRSLEGPVLVHVVTKKGYGYRPALECPEDFHGTGPFDCETGQPASPAARSFMSRFGAAIVELAGADDRIVAITAGMCLGTGLVPFRARFPGRLFDVGICEQHAVTYGAGLALAGLKPVVAIYSTFLQRAVDQIVMDVCLQHLPVVFAVDRAGLVGEDGPTHHGVFDLSYLCMIPGMTVMAPMDETELGLMLEHALKQSSGPTAIRYPRGGSGIDGVTEHGPIVAGRSAVLREGGDGVVLALGSMVGPSLEAADKLRVEGLELAVVNVRFAKPPDRRLIVESSLQHRRLITVEEGTLSGGFGAGVAQLVQDEGLDVVVHRIGLADRFVEQGPRQKLLELAGLTAEGLTDRFRQILARD